MTHQKRTWRGLMGTTITEEFWYSYKKEFALLPMQMSSGRFCWLKSFYTKIKYSVHWSGADHVEQVGRFTEEELLVHKLMGE